MLKRLSKLDKTYLISLLLALFPITGILGLQWFPIKRKKVGIIWLSAFIIVRGLLYLAYLSCKSSSTGGVYICVWPAFLSWLILEPMLYIAAIFSFLPQVAEYLKVTRSTNYKNFSLFSLIVTVVSGICLLASLVVFISNLSLISVDMHQPLPNIIFSLPGLTCIFSLLLTLANCISLFINKNFFNYIFIVYFSVLGNILFFIFIHYTFFN